MYIVIAILMFGFLIFIHELGHYYAGRLFGVKAETFSIGFGRELFGWMRAVAGPAEQGACSLFEAAA